MYVKMAQILLHWKMAHWRRLISTVCQKRSINFMCAKMLYFLPLAVATMLSYSNKLEDSFQNMEHCSNEMIGSVIFQTRKKSPYLLHVSLCHVHQIFWHRLPYFANCFKQLPIVPRTLIIFDTNWIVEIRENRLTVR